MKNSTFIDTLMAAHLFILAVFAVILFAVSNKLILIACLPVLFYGIYLLLNK